MLALNGDLLVIGPAEGPFRVLDLPRLLAGPAAGPSQPVAPPALSTLPVAALTLIPAEIGDWASSQSPVQLKLLAEELPRKISIRESALKMAQNAGNDQIIPAITRDLTELRQRLQAVQMVQGGRPSGDARRPARSVAAWRLARTEGTELTGGEPTGIATICRERPLGPGDRTSLRFWPKPNSDSLVAVAEARQPATRLLLESVTS